MESTQREVIKILKEYKIVFCGQWLNKEVGKGEGWLNIKLLSVFEVSRPRTFYYAALLAKPKNKRRQYTEVYFSYCVWDIYDTETCPKVKYVTSQQRYLNPEMFCQVYLKVKWKYVIN